MRTLYKDFKYEVVPTGNVMNAEGIINNHPIKVDLYWVSHPSFQNYTGHLNVISEDYQWTEMVHGFEFTKDGEEIIFTNEFVPKSARKWYKETLCGNKEYKKLIQELIKIHRQIYADIFPELSFT